MNYNAGQFDIAVIGAGHAGIEAALAAALKSGKLSAAAVDVLCREPPADGSPLIGLDNCIVTPHIAWAPREARLRLLDIAAANLRGWLEGQAQNVVS